jgi:hypothetical protein
MMPVSSIAATDRIRQEVNAFPGVFDTLVTFPVRNVGLPATMEGLLRSRAEHRAESSSFPSRL